QFLIGVFVISGTLTFSRIVLTLIVSDLIGKSKQGSGWLFGLMMGAGGLSQSTGPLWTYELYLLVGNRTWLVSTVLSFMQFILIILFIIFFKQFKPKKEPNNNTMNEETVKEEDRKELLQFEEMNEEIDDDKETRVCNFLVIITCSLRIAYTHYSYSSIILKP
uniref:Uncharacterized protein n=1 Tax=Amphimedon queenslandica TaxID=400682 RepID=A0A1X7UM79_AMPQE